MKNFLYSVVAQTSGRSVLALDWIQAKFLYVNGFLYGIVRISLASFGYFLLNLLDRERTEQANMNVERQHELERQTLELKLLAAASQVRDHAENSDSWTDEHTDAISAIGDTLLNDFGWDEQNIHQYLREVVESIEGLSYDLEP